jgi:hypothetical protein
MKNTRQNLTDLIIPVVIGILITFGALIFGPDCPNIHDCHLPTFIHTAGTR